MHPGRKRKLGHREPNGQLQRSPRQLENAVLRQPHRLEFGEFAADQRAESPLGRLCLRHALPRPAYDAGLAYGSLVRRLLAAKASPVPIHSGYPSTGAGPSPL